MYSEIWQKGIDEVVLNYLIKMKESASRDYIIAGIYSRAGDEQKAMEHFRLAYSRNPKLLEKAMKDLDLYDLIIKYKIK